jgi:hypothetical protein
MCDPGSLVMAARIRAAAKVRPEARRPAQRNEGLPGRIEVLSPDDISHLVPVRFHKFGKHQWVTSGALNFELSFCMKAKIL